MNQSPLLASPSLSESRRFTAFDFSAFDFTAFDSAGVHAAPANLAPENAACIAAADAGTWSNSLRSTDAYLATSEPFAVSNAVPVSVDICVTTKRTWTNTAVTMFGTHRQRPKEFAL